MVDTSFLEVKQTPNWARGFPLVHINEAARLLDIDPAILMAIAQIESLGVPWKSRFEPFFKNVYYVSKFSEPLGISFATEEIAQKTSHGLLQIMGAVARELGYMDYLTKLYEPALGAYWGALKFSKLLSKHGDLLKAVSCYNAGSLAQDGSFKNEAYVNKFKRYYFDIRRPPISLVKS